MPKSLVSQLNEGVAGNKRLEELAVSYVEDVEPQLFGEYVADYEEGLQELRDRNEV